MINPPTNSLSEGDELLSVNGTVLAGYSLEEAYEALENFNTGDLLCCVARNSLGLDKKDYFRQ